METIESIIRETATRITNVVRESIMSKLNGAGARAATAKITKSGKLRKKGPIQLCPAPGCKERAAPVFGMVCAKHKGTAKSTIAKWREARRKSAAKAKKN